MVIDFCSFLYLYIFYIKVYIHLYIAKMMLSVMTTTNQHLIYTEP